MLSKIKRWFRLLRRREKRTQRKSSRKMLANNKNTVEKIRISFAKAKEEIRSLKELSDVIQHKHVPRLDRLENLQQTNDEILGRHWEWIQHHKDQLHEQRVHAVELKAQLQELERSMDKLDKVFREVENIGEVAEKIREIEKKIEGLESASKVRAEASAMNLVQQALASQSRQDIKAAPAAPMEIINNLRPNERRVFGILFNQFAQSKTGWVPFSELLTQAYPTHEDKKTSISLLAKAMKPLYDTQLVEKQKRKNSAFVRPTKAGLDAAKEVGMIEQKKKLEELYDRVAS